MKIVHLLASGPMSVQWEGWFSAMRATGVELVAARSEAEVALRLVDPEFVASLHIAGAGDIAPRVIAERAIRYPDKLTVVAGSLPDVVREFTAVLRRSEVELLVLLDETDNVAAQIRRYIPLCLTRRFVLMELLPKLESKLVQLSNSDRKLLDWLLHDCPVVHGASASRTLSEREMKRLNTLLRRARLPSVFEIVGAIQLILFHAYVTYAGYEMKEAARFCGYSDPRLLRGRAAKVTGSGDLAALSELTAEELSLAVLVYTSGVAAKEGSRLSVPLADPVVLEWLGSAGGTMVQAAPERQTGIDTEVMNRFFDALVGRFGRFVERTLLGGLRHAQRAEDASQEVWFAVWLKVEDGRIRDIPLTMEGLESHAAAWKALLASICQNEGRNLGKGVDRRANLNSTLLWSEADWDRFHSLPESADKQVLREERATAVRAAVAALSVHQQEAVESMRLEGLTAWEAHLKLGRPESTIRNHLASATKKLRITLGGTWEDWKDVLRG